MLANEIRCDVCRQLFPEGIGQSTYTEAICRECLRRAIQSEDSLINQLWELAKISEENEKG